MNSSANKLDYRGHRYIPIGIKHYVKIKIKQQTGTKKNCLDLIQMTSTVNLPIQFIR